MSLIYNSLFLFFVRLFLLLITRFYAANLHKNSHSVQKQTHFFRGEGSIASISSTSSISSRTRIASGASVSSLWGCFA